MTARGRPARRDANEGDIVKALRKAGFFVVCISSPGAPDLLVRLHNGGWMPIEVKSATGHIREKQEAAQYPIVRTISEALKAVGVEP